MYTLRDTTISLVFSRTKMIDNNSTASRGNHKNNNDNKNGILLCLAHVVKGVFYSVVVNRRQPNPCIDIPGM